MRAAPKRLPYKAYYLPVLILSIAGILNALYLSFLHYKNYTDPTYASFCALSRAINCDTVAQSPWSILFGVPVAIWGLIGYLFFTSLLIPLRKPLREIQPLWSLVVICGGGYALVAVYFGYIAVSEINSYCILCLLTYGINFSLFFSSWLIRRRFSASSLFLEILLSIRIVGKSKWYTGSLVTSVLIALSLIVFLPHYWSFSLPKTSYDINHGMTDDGHPWIGAESPQMTIHEFSDYMCFQCKKMHFMLRQLVEQHPERLRLVHRQFPVDHQYNPLVKNKYHGGSGKMSIIALYASMKGQFWQVNDLLFEIAGNKEDFNTRTVADFMDVPVGEVSAALENKFLRLRLKHDIAVGINGGINGTPAFVIDDEVYIGTIPKDILAEIKAKDKKL